MITVVNESQTEFKVAGWQIESKAFSFDDFICDIENETVLFYTPSRLTYLRYSEKPKRKLSVLRGKMTKQSEKEIDKQISKLRSEWTRNI
ncbi:MAG: hypothetical protein KAH13_04140 [Tenericutes bacterium]|nr:hypothetical protein [Mycoplasmatota bacterium]